MPRFRYVVSILLAILTAAGSSTAQEPRRSSGNKAQTLQVELTSTIKAKKAKAGDLVKARTVTALVLPGQLVIPERTKVIGHVTQATPGASGGNAVVAIAFDRFELRKQSLPANFVVRSGALRDATAKAAPAYDDAGDAEFPPTGSPSARSQKPTHMTMGGFTNSTKSTSPQSKSAPLQPQQAAPSVLGNPDRSDLRAVPRGSLIGMPGVMFRLNEASGAATFESSNRKLELKSGLQLTLGVDGVKAAARPTDHSQPK